MSEKNQKSFIVRIIDNNDINAEKVFLFAKKRYEEKLSAIPSQSQEYIAIFQNNSVVGVVGIDYGCEGVLPYEVIFTSKIEESPFKFFREESMYFSKFTASMNSLSPVLMHYTAKRALEKGCKFGAAILDGKTFEFFKSAHKLDLREWRSELLIDKVSNDVKAYFLQNPSPKLYLVLLEDIILNSKKEVDRMIEEGRLKVVWS